MEKWFDVSIFLNNPLITFIKIFKEFSCWDLKTYSEQKCMWRRWRVLGQISHQWFFANFQGLVLLLILLISLTWFQIIGDFIFLSISIMSTLGMSFTIIAACLHVLHILKKKSSWSLLCLGHWEPHFGPLEPSDLH